MITVDLVTVVATVVDAVAEHRVGHTAGSCWPRLVEEAA